MSELTLEEREAVFDLARSETEAAASAKEAETAALSTAEPEEAPELEPAPVITRDATPPIVIIPLRHPFTIDGLRVRKVELREPTFANVRAVADCEISALDMFADMAGLPVTAMKAMRWPDFERVAQCAAGIAPDAGGR